MKIVKVLALLFIVATIVGGIGYAISQQDKPDSETQIDSGSNGINLEPATEDDKTEAERNKQRIIDEQEQAGDNQPPSSETKRDVVPLFGYLRQADNNNVEANGYVSEVIENDGTCTLTLERQGTSITTSKQALPDAQSTICGLMTIERSKLSVGGWKATITYSSPTAQGISETKTIMVN